MSSITTESANSTHHSVKDSNANINTNEIEGPEQKMEINYDGLGGRNGWFAHGDRLPEEKRVPFNKPSLRQIYDVWPFVVRYAIHWFRHYYCPERLFINTFQPLHHRPFYGVPCGGIGCGAIGRDFRGGFCKFSLLPGLVEHSQVEPVKANQFILNLSRNGHTIRQVVLSAVSFPSNASELSAWKFFDSPSKMTYRGLYPRSWSRFEFPTEGAVVTCRQVSPVLPGNYKDTSLPVTVFVFSVENLWNEPLHASITFTFRDGTAERERCKVDVADELQSAVFHTSICRGVLLHQSIRKMKCTYAISASAQKEGVVSICTAFDPDSSGIDLWDALQSDELEPTYSVENNSSKSRLGVAITRRIVVNAHEKSADDELEFCLAWHMPLVHFGYRTRELKRRYTRFFGVDAKNAADLCDYALHSFKRWEAEIDSWQQPVLDHPNLPSWFKSALFNELYYLTDGGSIWMEYDDTWADEEPQLSNYTIDLLREYGRFGYLESWEYRMINTYDVHFYASFAIAELFPALEHVLHADMKDHVEYEDNTKVVYHMHGNEAPRKSFMRVPHDLGNPAVEPWLITNAYLVHDTSKWKDLNLKFILISYRNYYSLLKCDQKFLEFVWPTVKGLIEEALTHWDCDNDGMIENFGFADQTYDAWTMHGVSAYCGSLWIASLCAAAEMANDIGDIRTSLRFREILKSAKNVFETKLWNGNYYNFDESDRCGRTIMADQLCGYWFLGTVNQSLTKNLLPESHVNLALQTIFDNNVMKFGNGQMGAVNGMRPNGIVEHSYIQADEMWTGITYALASFFIQKGDLVRGFKVACGCYETCYEQLGLQYQTPEAVYESRFYRAIGYMRPLAIWSMYVALKHQNFFQNSNNV